MAKEDKKGQEEPKIDRKDLDPVVKKVLAYRPRSSKASRKSIADK